jgi:tyrosine decarboxylase/aspartate 1-decarboxylase
MYNELINMEHIHVTRKPELNIISFTSDIMEAKMLKNELLKYGWRISISQNPYAIRLVLMPHVKKEHIISFLNDLKEIILNND